MSLNSAEFSRFGKYIRSPYYCENAQIISFFTFLEPRHPEYGEAIYEDLSRIHYQGELAKGDYNLLKSYLLDHIYHFLTVEKVNRDFKLKNEILVDELIRRENYQEAKRKLEKVAKEMQESEALDSKNLIHKIIYHQREIDIILFTGMHRGESLAGDFFKALDQLYAGLTLKYLLPEWTYHNLYGKEFPAERYQGIEKVLEGLQDNVPPLARLYHLLLILLKTNLEEEAEHNHRQELYGILNAHSGLISQNERINLYGYLQNYLNHQYMKGKPQSLEALFDLYQRIVRDGVVFNLGEFTQILIRNITHVACRLGELGWIRRFFASHQADFEGTDGENIYENCLAIIEFAQGNYRQVLHHLGKVAFKDLTYRTAHQVLLMRTYFELQESEALLALMHTFRRFLNRKSALSENQKDPLRNFLTILHQLIMVREQGKSSARRDKIQDLLTSTQKITDRTWLEKKFAELAG